MSSEPSSIIDGAAFLAGRMAFDRASPPLGELLNLAARVLEGVAKRRVRVLIRPRQFMPFCATFDSAPSKISSVSGLPAH
jgi:hypothetical protein